MAEASSAFETLRSLLLERHSCRAFLPAPLASEEILRVLDAAQRTASWCNAQPWQVYIAGGPRLERLREALQAAVTDVPTPDLPWPRAYNGVYRERRRACAMDLYAAVGIAEGDRAASARQASENFRLFGAPHLAIVTADEASGPMAPSIAVHTSPTFSRPHRHWHRRDSASGGGRTPGRASRAPRHSAGPPHRVRHLVRDGRRIASRKWLSHRARQPAIAWCGSTRTPRAIDSAAQRLRVAGGTKRCPLKPCTNSCEMRAASSRGGIAPLFSYQVKVQMIMPNSSIA